MVKTVKKRQEAEVFLRKERIVAIGIGISRVTEARQALSMFGHHVSGLPGM